MSDDPYKTARQGLLVAWFFMFALFIFALVATESYAFQLIITAIFMVLSVVVAKIFGGGK